MDEWQRAVAALEWKSDTAHLMNSATRPQSSGRRRRRTITFVGGKRYESDGGPSPSVQAKCDQYDAALRNQPLAMVSRFAMASLMGSAHHRATREAMATDTDPTLPKIRAIQRATDDLTRALHTRQENP